VIRRKLLLLRRGIGQCRCSDCRRFLGFRLGFWGVSHGWCFHCMAKMFNGRQTPKWLLEYGRIIREGP
jgi:hypothetical protein